MTVEQFKAFKKRRKLIRELLYSAHIETKEEMLKKYLEEENKEGYELIMESTFSNTRLNLPQTSFTKKLRTAFEELILNDVAAVEGRCCNTCSMDYVRDMTNDMKICSGVSPESFCFFHNQDISDIRNGFLNLGWGGDVDLIKSILEMNGLKVSYKNENTKLVVTDN